MKIVLATYGSRGDVQPMLALSLALQRRGHDVLLAGPPENAGWARQLGCPFQSIGQDVRAFIDTMKDAHSLGSALKFVDFLHRSINDLFHGLYDVTADADFIIASSLVFVLASLAEFRNIPYAYIAFTPQLFPSRHHPVPIFKYQKYPGCINSSTWNLVRTIDRFNMTRRMNRLRRKMGLHPIPDFWPHILGKNVIVASDPGIAPVPPDVSQSYTQTGYMHLNQPDTSNPDLKNFLEAGTPPVYAGFGSMPRQDQNKNVKIIVESARRTGQRIIISGFPGKISGRSDSIKTRSSSDDIFFIQNYPHLKLFPKMAAVIHHGGAGTTASAAASGVPQIIIPHILDQYYWGHHIHMSGLGPEPIWRRALTVKRLSQSIELCLSDPGVMNKAVKTAEKIRAMESLEMAADLILDR